MEILDIKINTNGIEKFTTTTVLRAKTWDRKRSIWKKNWLKYFIK